MRILERGFMVGAIATGCIAGLMLAIGLIYGITGNQAMLGHFASIALALAFTALILMLIACLFQGKR